MNEQEYRQYKLLRNTMTYTLQQIWPSIKKKIETKIDEAGTTQLGNENALYLKSIIDDLEEKCVNNIINFQWPSEKIFSDEYEKNLKSEARLAHEVVRDLWDIYSTFFNPFIGEVHFSSSVSTDSLPKSKKFRYYNIDLRHPKNGKPDFSNCDADNAWKLLKSNKYKMELLQGYWETESMLKELRNHEEHWKRDAKPFLETTLKRHLSDPISDAEVSANIFTLSSIIFLVSHHFIEILQTWIDTCKLIE